MGVKSNLPVLMAEQKIKGITELMELSGLSRNAINRVYDDRDEKINATSLKTLIALCDSLNCSLSDLIEYVPEQKKSDGQ
ncbi:helix-turn-helix domain-containing protein [Viridibacillus arvi]|uniref:helix-turn-helix domain-containing protein n=1 Tax=Viridibacillus arvi TaxID=263475 RepID=UPI003CFF13A6